MINANGKSADDKREQMFYNKDKGGELMAKDWTAVAPDGSIHELSYVDLLIELQDMVDSDAIYEEDKEDINNALAILKDKLWRYSY